MTSPYLTLPRRSINEVRGMKITKLPETGDMLWLTPEAFYEPPPLARRRSRTPRNIAIILALTLVAGACLVGPILSVLGSL